MSFANASLSASDVGAIADVVGARNNNCSSNGFGFGDGNGAWSHTGRRYSMRTGHSINDRMIDKLERMYDEAQTDHEREVVGSWIDRIRNDTRGQQY